ncbi:MAG TPA: hypothetical protein DCG47_05980 [Spirochaetaceae bacterium]|nr:hypothetical protein [Spirochaetaceae bacterium]
MAGLTYRRPFPARAERLALASADKPGVCAVYGLHAWRSLATVVPMILRSTRMLIMTALTLLILSPLLFATPGDIISLQHEHRMSAAGIDAIKQAGSEAKYRFYPGVGHRYAWMDVRIAPLGLSSFKA